MSLCIDVFSIVLERVLLILLWAHDILSFPILDIFISGCLTHSRTRSHVSHMFVLQVSPLKYVCNSGVPSDLSARQKFVDSNNYSVMDLAARRRKYATVGSACRLVLFLLLETPDMNHGPDQRISSDRQRYSRRTITRSEPTIL